jgi:hypothetical protein
VERVTDTETTRPLAVPRDIQREDAVSEGKPSGLNDALSVRK